MHQAPLRLSLCKDTGGTDGRRLLDKAGLSGGQFDLVNLLHFVQVTLRGFFPHRFARYIAVVTPQALGNSKPLNIFLQDARTKVDVILDLEKVDIFTICRLTPRWQVNLHDADSVLT